MAFAITMNVVFVVLVVQDGDNGLESLPAETRDPLRVVEVFAFGRHVPMEGCGSVWDWRIFMISVIHELSLI